MINFYIENDNKIIGVDTDKDRLLATVGSNFEIKETEKNLILSEDNTYYIFEDSEELQEKRKQNFYNNFIITSWGAFRKNPRGYSSAVEAVNTIFNMVNVAQSFTEQLANLLIFYEVPDFSDSQQCTQDWLIAHQKTHEACDLATFMKWYLEFQTVWAQTQYTDKLIS